MRRRDEDRGAAALEFGLIAPLVLLMIFGIIQYGWLFWASTTARASLRESARQLVVGKDWDTCALATVKRQTSSIYVGDTAPEISHRLLDSNGNVLTRSVKVGDQVEVRIRFHVLNLKIPLLPVPQDGLFDMTVYDTVENDPQIQPPC